MKTRKWLFLFILATGVLLTGTRGHASHVDFGRGADHQTEFSTIIVQPVGSTHFSFEYHIGGHNGYGNRRHHRGGHYRRRHHGHGYYYDRYPYRYGYRYRHRPYYRDYRSPGPYYRDPFYW